ncbi:hypothetical protein D3C72_1833140 [compost metagenome]
MPANWLKPTLAAAGFTPDQVKAEGKIDFSGDIVAAPKAWKDVWSAGHGVGAVRSVATVAEVVAELETDYVACLRAEQSATAALMHRYAQSRAPA